MAIDSSLFMVDVPAGTYAVGDVIPMAIHTGPANVRSGRGTAILKRITSGKLGISSSNLNLRIHVKNSDWVDEVVNLAGTLNSSTGLDVHSGLIQFGNDCPLTENSGWQIYAEVIRAGTTTTAFTAFALIDIDYPSVSSVTDPDKVIGIPCTISLDVDSSINADGSAQTANWTVKNVDYFKAGYQYCIQEIGFAMKQAVATAGFVSLANAAGMGGLQRIVPVNFLLDSIRTTVQYASKLVKGPMDVKLLLFQSSATTDTVYMVHDYVKRSA